MVSVLDLVPFGRKRIDDVFKHFLQHFEVKLRDLDAHLRCVIKGVETL